MGYYLARRYALPRGDYYRGRGDYYRGDWLSDLEAAAGAAAPYLGTALGGPLGGAVGAVVGQGLQRLSSPSTAMSATAPASSLALMPAPFASGFAGGGGGRSGGGGASGSNGSTITAIRIPKQSGGSSMAAPAIQHIHALSTHRRMNVLNPKALRRALRRAEGFEKQVKKFLKICKPHEHVEGFKKLKGHKK